MNPLLVELVFPWLRGANLVVDVNTTSLIIPDCSAADILALVDHTLRKVIGSLPFLLCSVVDLELSYLFRIQSFRKIRDWISSI